MASPTNNKTTIPACLLLPGFKLMKSEVSQKFAEIREALETREKLLYRQLDAIYGTLPNQENPILNVRFIPDKELEIISALRNFGRFQLDNSHIYLQNEDYIAPTYDHEIMHKCLDEACEAKSMEGSIVVDFKNNQSLVNENAKLLNKSIVNITLREAKDLIRKARIKCETPLTSQKSYENEGAKSPLEDPATGNIPELNQKAKKARFKPKITINNCNGIINLRNIASLTINCSNDKALSADIPLEEQQPYHQSHATDSTTSNKEDSIRSVSNSNGSSCASSRKHSKKQKATNKTNKHKMPLDQSCTRNITTDNYVELSNADNDGEITCNFYNRLLDEIKNNVLIKQPCQSEDSSQMSKVSQNFILKNFENLRIVLEANNSEDETLRPVQIEQWLAEIVCETDQEPTAHIDILEHSKLNSSESF